MGKRKRDYEDIIRKIRKIASKRKRRRHEVSSSDSESDYRGYESKCLIVCHVVESNVSMYIYCS